MGRTETSRWPQRGSVSRRVFRLSRSELIGSLRFLVYIALVRRVSSNAHRLGRGNPAGASDKSETPNMGGSVATARVVYPVMGLAPLCPLDDDPGGTRDDDFR